MNSTLFSEATPEQFKKFWEDNGFEEYEWENDETLGHCKPVKLNGNKLLVSTAGELLIEQEETDCVWLGTYATFEEALEALNELANTKVMGGWANG